MEKLTDAQRKLITDNHKLIYGFLNKNQLSVDDFYMPCAYALCKAAAAYDGKRPFSTLAYVAMKNAVYMEYRDNNAKKRKGETFSMNMQSYENNDGNTLTLESMLADPKDYAADIETKDAVKKWADGLTDLQRQILDMLLNGMTQREIGKQIGKSQAQISRDISVIKIGLQAILKYGG